MTSRTRALTLSVLGVIVGVVAGLVASGAAMTSGAASADEPPAPDTIVEVTGDTANGFTITHYDGTSLHPPTDSEAMAECSEYDTRVDRVRCRTEVRTWYRDLADLQQAIRYQQSLR